MTRKYVLDGKKPVEASSLIAWATWFETADTVVKQTSLGDVKILTVFLGLDYQLSDGPPLLFETMVFGGKYDGDQWRYSTWDEAVAGHDAVVARIGKGETDARGKRDIRDVGRQAVN